MLGLGISQLLGERRSFAENRAFPVDDIYSEHEKERDTCKYRGGISEVLASACTFPNI